MLNELQSSKHRQWHSLVIPLRFRDMPADDILNVMREYGLPYLRHSIEWEEGYCEAHIVDLFVSEIMIKKNEVQFL